MPRIPQELEQEHVRQAIVALDAGLDHDFGNSRDYDLLYDGKRYPPKAVVGIAAEFAIGHRLHPSDFSSGIGSGQSCRILKNLGFSIVGKDSDVDVFYKPTFIPGRIYLRRELHEQYGGQGQGGISTPKDFPIILLVTGESGNLYGYTDGFRDDGTFWYTGEGQVGDMKMTRGNAAILNHRANAKVLHLFRDLTEGNLQYISESEYVDHHTEVAPDRDGNPRKTIVFELSIRSETAGSELPSVNISRPRERTTLWNCSMSNLRELAITDSLPDGSQKERKAFVRQRSEAVRVYVLRRANGVCEGCSSPAPFMTSDNRPYLEPHHIRRLADGGPDHPRWVVALCPNCHARVHYGADGNKFNAELIDRLSVLEAEN